MSYQLLSDLLVIEVAQFGPDALGGYLADMGARVIKVEPPVIGDPLRTSGALSVGGGEEGLSYLHLRWNRGKQSIELDLATAEGVASFRKLAARADVVIEGMRAGVLERLGLGYEVLKAANPKLVFCSLSGMGRSGPYAKMASHGQSFDAFGGLSEPLSDVVSKYECPQPPPIGMHAMGVYSAVGVLAAVISARTTGQGTLVEVAAAECSAHWLPEGADPLLNAAVTEERASFNDASGRMRGWARMENYRTKDGKIIFLQSLTPKSWGILINLLQRPDLQQVYERQPATGQEDAEVAEELKKIFLSRTRAEWLADFREHNVAAMPVNSFADLIEDPHFVARDNTYQVNLPDGRPLTLTSTPIRVEGQTFKATLAPALGEHSEQIREEFGLT